MSWELSSQQHCGIGCAKLNGPCSRLQSLRTYYQCKGCMLGPIALLCFDTSVVQTPAGSWHFTPAFPGLFCCCPADLEHAMFEMSIPGSCKADLPLFHGLFITSQQRLVELGQQQHLSSSQDQQVQQLSAAEPVMVPVKDTATWEVCLWHSVSSS